MARKSFFGMGIGVLLLIGLTVLGSILMYQTGWSRGYATGILAAGVQDGVLAPTSPIYPAPASVSNGPLWGLAIFMLIGLGFLALVVMGRMFHMRTYRQMAGDWGAQEPSAGGHWGAHHKWRHGPVPPWCWHAVYEEKVEESNQAGHTEEAGK